MSYSFISSPSPNFDERCLPVDLLVLHYTGMASGKEALERLCDPVAKVSAHYMIEEGGRIFHLVDEDKRAWHAGVSSWEGETDINSRSIGVELVNGGHDYGLPAYPDKQIRALLYLLEDIIKRWPDLHPSQCVGHSDIAPARKQDPGELFPWQYLAEAGFGLWPEFREQQQIMPALPAFSSTTPLSRKSTGEPVLYLQKKLALFGYGLEKTGCYDEQTEEVVRAFHRHFYPENLKGCATMTSLALLESLCVQKHAISHKIRHI